MRLKHRATIEDFKNSQNNGIYIGQIVPNNGTLIFDRGDKSTFIQAIHEIKNNKKESHWIWYVIPSNNYKGSITSNFFSVSEKPRENTLSVSEYLSDKIRMKRYIKIIELLAGKNKYHLIQLFGIVDYNKLVKSIKIFYPILLQKIIKLDKIKKLYNEIIH